MGSENIVTLIGLGALAAVVVCFSFVDFMKDRRAAVNKKGEVRR